MVGGRTPGCLATTVMGLVCGMVPTSTVGAQGSDNFAQIIAEVGRLYDQGKYAEGREGGCARPSALWRGKRELRVGDSLVGVFLSGPGPSRRG